jgi:hypothetical protein
VVKNLCSTDLCFYVVKVNQSGPILPWLAWEYLDEKKNTAIGKTDKIHHVHIQYTTYIDGKADDKRAHKKTSHMKTKL